MMTSAADSSPSHYPSHPPPLSSLSGSSFCSLDSESSLSMSDPSLVAPPLQVWPWTKEEDEVLLKHVAEHGTGKWKLLEESGKLPRRNSKACKSRYRRIRLGRLSGEVELDPTFSGPISPSAPAALHLSRPSKPESSYSKWRAEFASGGNQQQHSAGEALTAVPGTSGGASAASVPREDSDSQALSQQQSAEANLSQQEPAPATGHGVFQAWSRKSPRPGGEDAGGGRMDPQGAAYKRQRRSWVPEKTNIASSRGEFSGEQGPTAAPRGALTRTDGSVIELESILGSLGLHQDQSPLWSQLKRAQDYEDSVGRLGREGNRPNTVHSRQEVGPNQSTAVGAGQTAAEYEALQMLQHQLAEELRSLGSMQSHVAPSAPATWQADTPAQRWQIPAADPPQVEPLHSQQVLSERSVVESLASQLLTAQQPRQHHAATIHHRHLSSPAGTLAGSHREASPLQRYFSEPANSDASLALVQQLLEAFGPQGLNIVDQGQNMGRNVPADAATSAAGGSEQLIRKAHLFSGQWGAGSSHVSGTGPQFSAVLPAHGSTHAGQMAAARGQMAMAQDHGPQGGRSAVQSMGAGRFDGAFDLALLLQGVAGQATQERGAAVLERSPGSKDSTGAQRIPKEARNETKEDVQALSAELLLLQSLLSSRMDAGLASSTDVRASPSNASLSELLGGDSLSAAFPRHDHWAGRMAEGAGTNFAGAASQDLATQVLPRGSSPVGGSGSTGTPVGQGMSGTSEGVGPVNSEPRVTSYSALIKLQNSDQGYQDWDFKGDMN